MNIDSDQCPQALENPIFLENLSENHTAAILVLAHGAGAPMDSPFMIAISQRLAARGIGVLRFEFPYMATRGQDGVRRPPNTQAVLLDCWRQVYAYARQRYAGPLAIGGKSMGGRMASLLADELGADALICLGYPFYARGKQDRPRVAHLERLHTPSLIVQGERDALGNRQAVESYRLSRAIRLYWLATADHDLQPLKRSGFTREQYLDAAADGVAHFLLEVSSTY